MDWVVSVVWTVVLATAGAGDGRGGGVTCTRPHLVFADEDGDGQGDPRRGREGPPATGWVANDGDCDDADARVHPYARDRPGDGLDADCDGCDGRCPD